MRQPLFGQQVEREGGADMIGNARRPACAAAEVLVGALIGPGAEQVRGKPELPFAFVRVHELPDLALQVAKHLDFRVDLAR